MSTPRVFQHQKPKMRGRSTVVGVSCSSLYRPRTDVGMRDTVKGGIEGTSEFELYREQDTLLSVKRRTFSDGPLTPSIINFLNLWIEIVYSFVVLKRGGRLSKFLLLYLRTRETTRVLSNLSFSCWADPLASIINSLKIPLLPNYVSTWHNKFDFRVPPPGDAWRVVSVFTELCTIKWSKVNSPYLVYSKSKINSKISSARPL